MKKWISLLLLFLFVPATLGVADIIPLYDNPFFRTHQSELTECGSAYEAVTDTSWYDEPGGKAVRTISEGTVVAVDFLWQDQWGFGEWNDQWIDLKDFRRRYDMGDFIADHQPEFIHVTGTISLNGDQGDDAGNCFSILFSDVPEKDAEELGRLDAAGAESLRIWTFPGSGQLARTVPPDDQFYQDSIPLSELYRDPEGRIWARVYKNGYMQADGWICLSDLAGELPAEGPKYAEEAGSVSAAGEPENVSAEPRSVLVPVIAVAAAVILSAVLLALLRKKSR